MRENNFDDGVINIPYSVHLLAELYNFENEKWPKNFRDEVRHELRRHGYIIQDVDYFGKLTAVAIKPAKY